MKRIFTLHEIVCLCVYLLQMYNCVYIYIYITYLVQQGRYVLLIEQDDAHLNILIFYVEDECIYEFVKAMVIGIARVELLLE